MNKLIIILITLVFLNNCSFNENSKIWNEKDKDLENKKNIKKVFSEENKITTEFNKDLKLKISFNNKNNKVAENQNNFGPQDYNDKLKKIGNFKFSKFGETDNFNYKPVFLSNGIIFFDRKGSILRYNKKQKIVWKKNHYSKAEKKLKPKLNFLLSNQNLIIADNISKFYSINISTGELNWVKNNDYPFNSEIKKFKDKFFVVDYNNMLKCYKIIDGSECWSLQTENSFTISETKNSLIIVDDKVIFSNTIGDITAVEIETGLIVWQLPTQSSDIINKTFDLKNSKLVSDGNSIFFSNNKYEFYSINIKTGTTNWINQIISNVTPKIVENLIFTISNEGYLFVIDKTKGDIIRITDLYEKYKHKKRRNIIPIGFAIGKKNIYLTNSDGRLIVASIDLGKINKLEKISGNSISEPFIFNNNLYIVRNGSIVQYN